MSSINITLKHASISCTLEVAKTSTVLSLKERISVMEEFGESVGGTVVHLRRLLG